MLVLVAPHQIGITANAKLVKRQVEHLCLMIHLHHLMLLERLLHHLNLLLQAGVIAVLVREAHQGVFGGFALELGRAIVEWQRIGRPRCDPFHFEMILEGIGLLLSVLVFAIRCILFHFLSLIDFCGCSDLAGRRILPLVGRWT